MLKFLRNLLAGFVGTILAIVFLVFMTVIVIAAISSSTEGEIKENSVLLISLDKEIVEQASDNILENFSVATGEEGKLGLHDMLKAIEKAKTDARIKGIILKADYINAGISTVDEIRNALKDFKTSGKFILSYSDIYTQKAYFLSTAADKVYINPEGTLLLKGLSLSTLYFKHTLEKIGITPQFVRHGKYKSAIEMFSEDEMSPENEYQLKELVDDIWLHVKNGIAATRSIETDSLDAWANALTIRSSAIAKEKGLVDDIKYKDEFLSECKDSIGIDSTEDIPTVSLSQYIASMQTENLDMLDEGKPQIAVIVAQGDIVTGEGTDDNIGGDKIARLIRKARTNKDVKAIVLRVNSGGGSSLASEVIWREASLAAKEKTFIVSMGDLAASGGYYIAAPADAIVAEPTTITGSIGVFGMFFSGEKLLDKAGISTGVVKSNDNADIASFAREMNTTELNALTYGIEQIYETFINHVAEGRGLDVAFVDSIGQGRVWSASDALQIGLVDILGDTKTAVKLAIDDAGLADTDYRIKYYPEKLDPFTALFQDIGGNAKASYMKKSLGEHYQYFEMFENVMKQEEGILAKIPYEIIIE